MYVSTFWYVSTFQIEYVCQKKVLFNTACHLGVLSTFIHFYSFNPPIDFMRWVVFLNSAIY